MELESTNYPEANLTLLTTGWKQPVYFITPGARVSGWQFTYDSGAVCYVERPLLALPERAARVDHAAAVFVTPDGYMTKQWVNAMAEYRMPVAWDESIRDYGTV